jgi:hypothetical protein
LTQPHYIKGRKIDCKIAIPKEHLATMNNTLVKDNDNDTTKPRHNNNTNSNSNSNSKTTKRTFTPVTPVTLNQPCSAINNANINYNTPPIHNESDDNIYLHHIQNQIQYTSSTTTHSPPLPANNVPISTNISSPSSSLLYLRKIFVGGLPPQLTTETLVNFFSKFGPIEKGMIMTNKYTGKKRGFGFLIFTHKETVDKIMSTSNCYCLCGKWIECKRAYPKEQQQQMITLNETNTNPSTSSNSDNDNDNYIVNDQCSNGSNLFMYQNYIPKSQIKFYNIVNVNNQSLSDQQNQFININSSNNNNQQHSQQQQQFQFYFNNCITNPSYQHYFKYKLFDKNGEDLSELMLYKNSQKTTLFTEETQNKMNNTIYTNNNNINNNTNINKHPIDYVYSDINKQMSNQSWIGNYFMNSTSTNTNTNNTSSNHSNNNNPIVNYYTNINSTYTNNTNLTIPTDINNNKPHQPLINDIDDTNTTINISNNNEVDVSSDFVDETNGSFNDDDCYGPNIQKRKLYNQNTFNDSYRPY